MDIISELTFSETECNRDMCPVDEEGQHGREDGAEWRACMMMRGWDHGGRAMYTYTYTST